jgi:hypothetical protein
MIRLGIKTWKLLKHETSRGVAFYIILRLVYFADVFPRRMTLLSTRSTRSADGGSTPLPCQVFLALQSCLLSLLVFWLWGPTQIVSVAEVDPGYFDCESVRVTRIAMNSPKYVQIPC